jgi:hypothetical protein
MAWYSDEKAYFGTTYYTRETLSELGFQSSKEEFRQFEEDAFVKPLW